MTEHNIFQRNNHLNLQQQQQQQQTTQNDNHNDTQQNNNHTIGTLEDHGQNLSYEQMWEQVANENNQNPQQINHENSNNSDFFNNQILNRFASEGFQVSPAGRKRRLEVEQFYNQHRDSKRFAANPEIVTQNNNNLQLPDSECHFDVDTSSAMDISPIASRRESKSTSFVAPVPISRPGGYFFGTDVGSKNQNQKFVRGNNNNNNNNNDNILRHKQVQQNKNFNMFESSSSASASSMPSIFDHPNIKHIKNSKEKMILKETTTKKVQDLRICMHIR